MKNKYLQFGSIVGLVLISDQITKYMIETRVRLHDVVIVIPGFFNITHVRNKGAAFGLLASLPDLWRCTFFIVVTIIAVVVILALVRKTEEGLPVVAFSLIAGGAVGNVIDRIRHCEVIDFIQWYVKSYYWPSFNVADSAISIGVVLLAIIMLFGTSTKSQAPI